MKIGIIGAGASGLLAAITAAKHGADVTLIEKKDRKVSSKTAAPEGAVLTISPKVVLASGKNNVLMTWHNSKPAREQARPYSLNAGSTM